MKEHHYSLKMKWVGNLGEGTATYSGYSRNHEISIAGMEIILGSSDPSFRGDASRYNPEDLLVAAISSCHMLWYLHLCVVNGIVVTHYEDHAVGIMIEEKNGSGQFKEVVLRPKIQISIGEISFALELHTQAHEFCFIARSVNFPVRCEPEISQQR
jgi:organic hydroperoxide reductase OsmC/OhrA